MGYRYAAQNIIANLTELTLPDSKAKGYPTGWDGNRFAKTSKLLNPMATNSFNWAVNIKRYCNRNNGKDQPYEKYASLTKLQPARTKQCFLCQPILR